MSWYERWVDYKYLKAYQDRNKIAANNLVDIIEKNLNTSPEEKVLDIACGNGSVCIALARRGYNIWGVEPSPPLIDSARKNAASQNLPIEFIEQNLQSIPYISFFDGAVSFFTSFGYFETDSDNFNVLRAIARALKYRGWFIIDYLNRPYLINTFIPKGKRKDGEVNILVEREIINNRVNKKIVLTRKGESKTYFESVRMYSFEEIEGMINKAGMKIEKTLGDYNGEKYSSKSPRLIITGRNYVD